MSNSPNQPNSPTKADSQLQRPGLRTPVWLKWLGPGILVLEVVLVWSGLLAAAHAVVIALVIETAMAVLALTLALTAGSVYRVLRGRGMSRYNAFFTSLEPVLPKSAVTLLRHETGVIVAFARGVRGRRDIPAGSSPVSYGAEQRPMVMIALALSVLEIGAVAWLVPWRWLEILLLVLGIYGLVWIAGFQLSFRTRPHLFSVGQIVLRCGHLAQVTIPAEAVLAIRPELTSDHLKVLNRHDDWVALALVGGTNTTAELREGTEVVLNDVERVTVSKVCFVADIPSAVSGVLAAARDVRE